MIDLVIMFGCALYLCWLITPLDHGLGYYVWVSWLLQLLCDVMLHLKMLFLWCSFSLGLGYIQVLFFSILIAFLLFMFVSSGCLSHMLRWYLWVGVQSASCEWCFWGLEGGSCLRDLLNCTWYGICGGFLFHFFLLGSSYWRSFSLASFWFHQVSSILFSFLSRLSFVWSWFSFWQAHLQWFHFLFFVSY